MAERCLMAASLAALVCHPNASIKCFRPKSQKDKSSPRKKQPSKSNNNNDFRSCSSLSRTSMSFNLKNMTTSTSPPFPASRSGRDSYLVSKLAEDEPSFGVIETIFKSGWDNKIGLKIEKVLKINHGIDVLNKFEEYREIIKSKSTNISANETKNTERLAVDGNEVLRFHGAILTYSLGNEEFSNICHRECCGICRMVSSSLSEGEEFVSLSKNSRQAHKKVATSCVNKIASAKKAVVVCRVIAGRVARSSRQGLVDGEEGALILW